MKQSKLLTILFIIVILSISWFFFLRAKQPSQNPQQEKIQNIPPPLEARDVYLNDIENNKNPDFIAAKKALEIGDVKNAPILWEKVVKTDEIVRKFKNNNTATKPKISSKTFLAASYLQYGNYYYKEKENADKAIKILTEGNANDDDYGADGMYFVGYAYEITKQYDKALEWYNKGLKVSSNTNNLNALFKNQIGHVYDLKWDMNKAYEYYVQAYTLNNKNYQASTNIWRFLARTGKFKESIPYFEYALNTKNLSLRSEIYYTLSSIELDLNWLKPDIDKSIQYAQASIKSFPDYPMGYVALARGLYMKNDKKYNKDIEENLEKSIKLNPNGYYAYEIAGLYEYDNGNYEKSQVLLQNSIFSTSKDMILMDGERKNIVSLLSAELLFLSVNSKLNDKDKIITFIKEFKKVPFWEKIINLQLMRINNGIFKKIENEKEFQSLVLGN